jgi:hypothetical protein
MEKTKKTPNIIPEGGPGGPRPHGGGSGAEPPVESVFSLMIK